MAIVLDGNLGITSPAETVQGALTTTGNTILGDASTDTLNVGNGGLVKDASGNVGIGTASPGNKLTVVSTGNIAAQITGKSTAAAFSSSTFWDGTGGGLQITNSETTTNAPTSIRFTQTGSTDAAAGIAAVFSSISASNLVFCTNNGGVTTPERMRITSTGNVTVGTDDLGYKLGVFSTSTGTPALNLRSSAAGDAGTAQLRIIKSTNTNTTSQIFAQFVIDGNNTNSGQINANGASAAAFGSFSDVRLKENIVNLPSQLANITALRPVEFDYKDGCGHQIGFIAQEMEQVYPDAIGVGENEMLTITGWSKTEARLVKAIQEQQALITQLQADVAALKALSA